MKYYKIQNTVLVRKNSADFFTIFYYLFLKAKVLKAIEIKFKLSSLGKRA